MQTLRDKMIEVDGIIFGTPIYFYDMTAQMKAVMDRILGLSLANKMGGVVAVYGSLGLIDALKDYAFYMMVRRMIPVGHVSICATSPDELRKMEKCMNPAHDMGRMIVVLVKWISNTQRSSPGRCLPSVPTLARWLSPNSAK